ncbi:hypothetical protein GN956_G3651 [Arapaima gigas]
MTPEGNPAIFSTFCLGTNLENEGHLRPVLDGRGQVGVKGTPWDWRSSSRPSVHRRPPAAQVEEAQTRRVDSQGRARLCAQREECVSFSWRKHCRGH